MDIPLRFTLPVLFLLAMPATAQELLTPDPIRQPESVVEIQLQSLQKNDVPVPDTGIAQTWAFAHPDNKRVTGPLERFAWMIKSPDSVEATSSTFFKPNSRRMPLSMDRMG